MTVQRCPAPRQQTRPGMHRMVAADTCGSYIAHRAMKSRSGGRVRVTLLREAGRIGWPRSPLWPPKLATLRNIAPCRKIALFHASSTTKPAKQTQLRMRCCPDAADAGTAWRRIASALWCSGAEGCTVYINAAACGHRSCGRASHPAKVTERHDVHIQTRERPVKCCPALEPRQPRP